MNSDHDRSDFMSLGMGRSIDSYPVLSILQFMSGQVGASSSIRVIPSCLLQWDREFTDLAAADELRDALCMSETGGVTASGQFPLARPQMVLVPIIDAGHFYLAVLDCREINAVRVWQFDSMEPTRPS